MKLTKFKLKNGLNVILKKNDSKIISGHVRVHLGTMHEEEGEEGIAHFLEHCLVMAGSKYYPPKKSKEMIERLGYFNAGTGIKQTNLEFEIIPSDLDKTLHFCSDILFYPLLNTKEVNQERGRVIREINDERSDLGFETNLETEKALFGEHPLQRIVLGKEEIIKKGNVQVLKKFHSKGYYPNNIDLILIGDLPNNTKKIVNKHFKNIKQGNETIKEIPPINVFKDKKIIYKYLPDLVNKSNPQESSADIDVHFLFKLKNSKDKYVLNILFNRLCLGHKSILYRRLSEERGIIYSVYPNHGGEEFFDHHTISTKVHVERIKEAVNIIFEELTNLRNKGLTKNELDLVKKDICFSLAKQTQSNSFILIKILHELDYKKSEKDLLKSYMKITTKEIKRIAKIYLPKNEEEAKYVLTIKDPLHKNFEELNLDNKIK